jgi:hypothetical protein
MLRRDHTRSFCRHQLHRSRNSSTGRAASSVIRRTGRVTDAKQQQSKGTAARKKTKMWFA